MTSYHGSYKVSYISSFFRNYILGLSKCTQPDKAVVCGETTGLSKHMQTEKAILCDETTGLS